jgi:hypothetical protein
MLPTFGGLLKQHPDGSFHHPIQIPQSNQQYQVQPKPNIEIPNQQSHKPPIKYNGSRSPYYKPQQILIKENLSQNSTGQKNLNTSNTRNNDQLNSVRNYSPENDIQGTYGGTTVTSNLPNFS